MAQLFSDRQALRKRSVVALGNLLIAAPKGLYANTMGTLINQLSRDKVVLLESSFFFLKFKLHVVVINLKQVGRSIFCEVERKY